MTEVDMEIIDGFAPDWVLHPVRVRSEAAIAWLRLQGLLTLDEAGKARSRLAKGPVVRLPSAFDQDRVERPKVVRDGEIISRPEPFTPYSNGSIEPVKPARLDKNRRPYRQPVSSGVKPPWES